MDLLDDPRTVRGAGRARVISRTQGEALPRPTFEAIRLLIMSNHYTEFGVGIMLLIAGLASLIQKRFELGLVRSRSVFTITLTGRRAICFGIASIIATAFTLLPWLYVNITNNVAAAADETLPFLAFLGIAVATLGFIGASFFQFLSYLRSKAITDKLD
jgi:hypothetical protein